jgi:hypothetical protein
VHIYFIRFLPFNIYLSNSRQLEHKIKIKILNCAKDVIHPNVTLTMNFQQRYKVSFILRK